MPGSFLSDEQRAGYGRYVEAPSAEDLARHFHLDDADRLLIAKRRGAHNRLGFAVQLGTVRYLGTFLGDPLAVPELVVRTMAKQLQVEPTDALQGYRTGEQRWQHAAEIRAHYGYVDITEPQIGLYHSKRIRRRAFAARSETPVQRACGDLAIFRPSATAAAR